jgi:tetratricopeptide (TPR) repeat protein
MFAGRYRLFRTLVLVALLVALPSFAQQVTVQGKVVDTAGNPVPGANIQLEGQALPAALSATTSADGTFAFAPLPAGAYRVTARKANLSSQTVATSPSGQPLLLVLAPQSTQAMEFADKPDFAVAGITDWTAVGGHGSDATLRTSEALARETTTLKPHGADSGETAEADRHRRQGLEDEQKGDPLAAVHEEELAVRLDPSEENYFVWGSELLLHRAVWQAAEVFRNGAKAHPTSSRMLTGLGAALFAGALYDEAAARLCQAADLDPSDPEPNSFLGRMVPAAPNPLPCVRSHLARYSQQHPGDAQALYFYAMAVAKENPADPQVETLLNRAVAIDHKCAPAWLQLGILAYTHHDPVKAIDLYHQAIEADPQLAEAHYRLGVAYDRMGKADQAAREFQLHDEIEKRQAAAVEQQRREVKQFLVVLKNQQDPQPH